VDACANITQIEKTINQTTDSRQKKVFS